MAVVVRHHSLPLEILDDLGSRFIINVPEEERKDLIRICFQIELAHWFYIDEYVSDESKASKYRPKLRSCTIREFAEHMFRHIGFLSVHADNVEQVLEDWKQYKLAVPTYGAIILNSEFTKVLLVQGFWSRTSWGFPKGKVNEEEAPHLCAVREVYEETGYDISKKIDKDDYLTAVINDQTSCLFVIPEVAEDTKFVPRTKKEIRDIKWFPVAGLPASKKEEMADPSNPLNPLGLSHNNLFMVIPFVRGLRKWIAVRKRGGAKSASHISRRSSQGSMAGFNTKPADSEGNKKPQRQRECVHAPVITDDFVPKAWQNFRLKRKDFLAAIDSVLQSSGYPQGTS